MLARASVALLALAVAAADRPQAKIFVDVAPHSEELDEVEKRYTPELVMELAATREDAALLYTEYTARAGSDLKEFLASLSTFMDEITAKVDREVLDRAPQHCRKDFVRRVKKIEYDTHRAASFSAENHHKFFLGHFIVFKMHLNKSADFINKCDKIVKGCGIPCETMPKVMRWRRHAHNEINRVREDMQHSRKSYRDLLLHSLRRLRNLRRQAISRADEVVQALQQCVVRG